MADAPYGTRPTCCLFHEQLDSSVRLNHLMDFSFIGRLPFSLLRQLLLSQLNCSTVVFPCGDLQWRTSVHSLFTAAPSPPRLPSSSLQVGNFHISDRHTWVHTRHYFCPTSTSPLWLGWELGSLSPHLVPIFAGLDFGLHHGSTFLLCVLRKR